MTLRLNLIAACAIAAYATTAWTASFDCAKATTFVEREICGQRTLSQLDDALHADYARAENNLGDLPADGEKEGRELVDAQRAWLKERNRCQTDDCLIRSYRKRISQLCRELRWHDPATSGQCAADNGLGGIRLDRIG